MIGRISFEMYLPIYLHSWRHRLLDTFDAFSAVKCVNSWRILAHGTVTVAKRDECRSWDRKGKLTRPVKEEMMKNRRIGIGEGHVLIWAGKGGSITSLIRKKRGRATNVFHHNKENPQALPPTHPPPPS